MGFFADNRNKILAIFAAVLMVAFTLPSSFSGGGGGMGDPVRARIGNQKVHVSEWKAAREEYEYVMSFPVKNDPQGRSIGEVLLPQIVRSQMQVHPDLYFLLVREAQSLGVRVPQDKVETLLRNDIVLRPDFTLDEETILRQAITHLLAIDMSLGRAIAPIKISEPLREHFLADRFQAIKVKLTEFDAADFKSLVSPPTTQQVQDQFTTYGNKDPENPDPKNVFAFGYRIPNRIKLQWIELRRADILAAAKAIHSDYDWDVAAQIDYRTNPQNYATTAPTSQPVVGKNPGIRPFAEVHQQILNKLQGAEADRIESAILARITSITAADYAAYKANPLSPPATSLGVPFGDYAYFEKLAAQIQREFKLLPAVVSIGDYKDQKQIAETAIGKATLNSTDAATYLTTEVEPFAPAADKSRALSILQLSPTLRDDAGNIYIARVTEADAARMPSSVADVKKEIDNDLRTVSAFGMARDAAVKLATAAQQGGLDKAATLANRKVISAGPFSAGHPDIPGYPLPPDSATRFVATSFNLLQTDPSRSPHPLTVVELPRIGKVNVVELEEVSPIFDPHDPVQLAEIDTELSGELTQRYAVDFLQQWFDYNQISERMDYKMDESAMKGPKTPVPSGNEVPPQQSPF